MKKNCFNQKKKGKNMNAATSFGVKIMISHND